MSIKDCGRHNFSKNRDIKDSDNYITFYLSLKCGSLDKMRITSLEPKYYLVRSGKGLITSLDLKTNGRSKKHKNSSYAIICVIIKDISKIIKEFKKLSYKVYVWKRHTHEPTDSYF